MEKKVSAFEVRDLLPIGLTFVIFGIAIAYGLSVMGDVRDDTITGRHGAGGCNTVNQTGCGADYNATIDAIQGVSKLPEKLPLIATVVVAAVIIGILVRYLVTSV